MDEINNLPTNVSDGQTGHLNSHQVIHAALKNHKNRMDVVEMKASVAVSTSENVDDRVAALESREGLSPESPVDGQTANLIAQPDSLTHAAIFGQFAEDPPGSGLFSVPGGDM